MSHFSYAPIIKGPHFFTKNAGIEHSLLIMIIYLLTFYQFHDIEKKYWNQSCESFCYAKGSFDKIAQLHVQSERLYFLFAFCAWHYPW